MSLTNDSHGMPKPYILFHKGVAIYANKDFEALTGYSTEELLKKDIFLIMNQMLRLNKKVDRLDCLKSIERCFIFNKLLDFKEVSIDVQYEEEKDLTYLFFKQRPHISFSSPLGYTYQLISDNLMGIALFSAEDFLLLKASKEYEKMIFDRFHETDIIGKKAYEYIADWFDSPRCQHWDEVMKTGKSLVSRETPSRNYSTGLTEYFDTGINPIFDNDKIKFLVITQINVTEKVEFRLENEKKTLVIEKQNSLLKAVIENQKDLIFIIDKSGNIVNTNKSAKIKYEGSRLAHIKDIFDAGEYFDQDDNRIEIKQFPIYGLLKGETLDDTYIRLIKDHQCTYLSLSGTPIYHEDGSFDHAFLCGADITEYVKHSETINAQQQALLMAEKKEIENLEKVIEMKDEFLSLISHEFKTPLTVINSALQAIEHLCKDELTPRLQSFLHKIKQNTFRQVRLVNNLLDITRANAGHMKLNMKNVDIIFITRSIVESVKLYAQQKGICISFSSEIQQKSIALDEEKYERILMNLLSNAIKYTPTGKCIRVGIMQENRDVRVTVEDEGIGIPKEKQEIIFERFGQAEDTYTRYAEGTGIGLYLAKLMVDALGGKISLQSEPDKGSTFIVNLPGEDVVCTATMKEMQQVIDYRLIQSIAIEFSDIYF